MVSSSSAAYGGFRTCCGRLWHGRLAVRPVRVRISRARGPRRVAHGGAGGVLGGGRAGFGFGVVCVMWWYLWIYASTKPASVMQVTRAPARTSTSTRESGNVRGRCSDAGSGDQASTRPSSWRSKWNKTISSAFMSLARGTPRFTALAIQKPLPRRLDCSSGRKQQADLRQLDAGLPAGPRP